MSNPGLIKSCLAGGVIPPFRILKFSALDTVVIATAATDNLMGVANEVGAASGERQDMVTTGIAFVEAGAAIGIGLPISSDGTGRAIAAAPAAGVNNRIIGFAFEPAAAAGDIVRVLLQQGAIQG